MEQKITLMHYLLIGISAISTLIVSCESRTEERVDADLIFKNDTDSKIGYSGLFELMPGNTHTEHVGGVGGEGPDADNCCQGALESFQGPYNQVYLILDDSLCVLYNENEGPTLLGNFESSILEKDHYQFTYTFKGDEFVNAKTCDH